VGRIQPRPRVSIVRWSLERGGQMRKKYYDDAKENAAFERCVDVVTALIL